MTLDESRDFHDQLFVSKRNFDVIVGAGSESLKLNCVRFANRADKQNRNHRRVRIIFEMATQFQSAHFGHDNIADDDVHPRHGRNIQRATHTRSQKDLVAFGLD